MTVQVLTGCVSSCEDHGYIVDLGVAGLQAFLTTAHAQEYLDETDTGLATNKPLMV